MLDETDPLKLPPDAESGGGDTENICPTGMCLFQGIVFASFLYNGVPKRRQFSGAGRQTMAKGEILLDWVIN